VASGALVLDSGLAANMRFHGTSPWHLSTFCAKPFRTGNALNFSERKQDLRDLVLNLAGDDCGFRNCTLNFLCFILNLAGIVDSLLNPNLNSADHRQIPTGS
jgi:hypothetical protein